MGTYMQGHHESVLRSHRWRTAENSAPHLLAHLRPGMSILDVGCGPGTITVDLARLVGPAGTVVGIDSSPDVVAVAAADAVDAGVRFEVGDAGALAFGDATFDVVHAHQVLQHLPDPVGALREMRRVAADDGIVAVRDADYGAMTWFPAVPGLDRWREVYAAVARAHDGEPDAGRRIRRWALDAGFTDVQVGASVWCFTDPEDRAWWGGMQADRTVASRLAEQAVAIGAASAQELEAIAAGWREWAASEDGWFAVVHGEALCRR